jgi:hypothetical protein
MNRLGRTTDEIIQKQTVQYKSEAGQDQGKRLKTLNGYKKSE